MKALYLKRNRNQWAIVLYSSLLIIVERVVPYKMLNPMFHLQPFDTHIDSQSMACRISVSPWGLAKCGSGSLHQIWSVRALGTRPSYWTFHLSSGMDAEFDLCLVSRPLRSTTRKKSALSHIWYLKFILKALAVGRHDWWAPPPQSSCEWFQAFLVRGSLLEYWSLTGGWERVFELCQWTEQMSFTRLCSASLGEIIPNFSITVSISIIWLQLLNCQF